MQGGGDALGGYTMTQRRACLVAVTREFRDSRTKWPSALEAIPARDVCWQLGTASTLQ